MKLVRLAGVTIGLIVVLVGQSASATIIADILFVIDDSLSMRNDINQVKTRIGDFDDAMVANDIDAQYGLVRFGGPNGPFGGVLASLEQDITGFGTFNDPAGFFANMGAPTSTQEPGSLATIVGLNNAAFRDGSVMNVILITDEDDDSTEDQFLEADQLLTDFDALFNFIGVPGVGNTDDRYGVLATNHGGTAFNILDFRSNPDPFFDNFIQIKVQEIIGNGPNGPSPMPEPGMLTLFVAGAIGFVFVRNRRQG